MSAALHLFLSAAADSGDVIPGFARPILQAMSNRKLLRGRWSEAGAYYAVTLVTEHREPIFSHAESACAATAELASPAISTRAESFAWVVMPDHAHWLLALKSGELGALVQAVKSRISRTVNRTSGRTGSVWQSGFYDHRLRSDEDLQRQARYIVANPLRRGLAQRLADYPYWWCRWVRDESDL